jgi:hypothetical protein
MKRKLKYIILIFISSTLFVTCTDLDMQLFDKIDEANFPENATQASLMTTPVYKPLQDFLDWGCWWFAQELTSDEMVCPTRLTDWDDGGKWRVLHTHTWDNETETVNSMWSRFYQGIGECNRLIEFFAPYDTDAARETIAKLKVMRAYYYYLLIDNYGDVPYVTSYSSAPAMPFKEHKAVIWDSITTDLEANVGLVAASATRTVISKGFAFSVMAKLYLNAEIYSGTPQWAKAEAYCDSVVQLGLYSLESNPLAPFVTENQNSTENIFTIPYDEDAYTGFNLHMRTLHYASSQTFNMSAGPWNGFCAMEEHYNSYDDTDLRKEGYFLIGQQYSYTGAELTDQGAEGAKLIFNAHIPDLEMDATYSLAEIRMSGARVKKFEIKLGAKENLSNDFPLFRYADILLMMAEAQVRQNKPVSVPELDMIRTRAGLNGWGGTVTLDEILEERGREMFWEGHRRQDLIRFGKFNEKWWKKDASTPDRNTFPVPQWVIDGNPNVTSFAN